MAPSVVLLPGMSSVGTVLHKPLKQELGKLGFTEIISLDLPSVDSTSRAKELQPDALTVDIKYIRSIVEPLVQEDKEVVVVAHSYGGTPSLYASEGLWKHEREAQGLKGGVKKAALISSSLSLPGTSIAGVRGAWAAEHMPEMVVAQEKSHVEMIDGAPFVFPDDFEKLFMADMTPEEQSDWAKIGLRPHPLSSVLTETPQTNVQSWRIAYLITAEQDQSMPEPLQKWLIENARSNGAEIEEVKTMKSGHFVQITHAEEVAAWIRDLSFTA